MHLRKKWIALFLGVAVLAACTGSEEAGEGVSDENGTEVSDVSQTDDTSQSDASGTMRLAFSQEPAHLDFMAVTQGNVHEKTLNVVEGLYAYDNTWTPQPMLATDAEINEDATSFTFTLREDVQFHDGSEFTAEDVIASLERWISVDSRAELWFENLTEMAAPDDHTVTMEFSTPVGQLRTYLAEKTAGIIPAELAEEAGTDILPTESVVGTGPYVLESWEPGVSMTLTANPNYSPVDGEPSGWSGEKHAYVERLEMVPLSDPGARLAGIQTGQFQFVDALPGDDYNTVVEDPNLEHVARPIGTGVAYFSSKSPLVEDVRVRQAILLALDMDEMALALGPEELTNISPVLPVPGGPYESDIGTENWNAADPERAQEMLDETDYNGETMTVIASSGTPASGTQAIVIRDQLAEIGIPVEVQLMESASMQEMRASGEGWEMAIGTLNASADMTTQTAIFCGNTVGGYCSEEMENLAAEFRQAADEETQKEIHDQIQALVYEDLPYIKLIGAIRLDVIRSSVEGWNLSNLTQPVFWNLRLTDA